MRPEIHIGSPPVGRGVACAISSARAFAWRRYAEMDATRIPGARADRCLIFDSEGVVRRAWSFPQMWSELDDESICALLERAIFPLRSLRPASRDAARRRCGDHCRRSSLRRAQRRVLVRLLRDPTGSISSTSRKIAFHDEGPSAHRRVVGRCRQAPVLGRHERTPSRSKREGATSRALDRRSGESLERCLKGRRSGPGVRGARLARR